MPKARLDMLVLKGVTKDYWNVRALDDVSFKVAEGEVFGYIGPNGAGKTTTIKILVGLMTDFQGDLRIGGLDMPQGKHEVHKVLGYLPQKVSFQQWRTVEHTLSTFGRLSGIEKKDLGARVREVSDLLGLFDVQKKRIGELSGGTVQKVGMAQALLHSPKLLVLDEPLSGLDPTSRYDVKSIIKDLKKKGTTVLFSSHILSDVEDVATRVGIINRGRMLKIGTIEELKEHLSVSHDIEVILSTSVKRKNGLEALRGVSSIDHVHDKKMLVHLDSEVDVDVMVHEIILSLVGMDSRIRSIRPLAPSLDDVYLKYVERGEQT